MVLITGGSGLVGSHLLLELLRRGREVRALHRPGSNLGRIRDLFAWYGPGAADLFEKIRWVPGDLNDLPSLEAACEGVDEVYHCAALISFDPGDADRLLKVNHEGTRNLVDVCLYAGVSRMCYTSSVATVGGSGGTLRENDFWDPGQTGVYATSKYLAEMEVWRGGMEGLQTVIVNPGVILGPGFWNAGSGLFFSRAASGLKYSPPGGTGFVGVWDVVRALMELQEAGAFNERFLLVAENLAYRDLLTAIAHHLQVPGPGISLSGWQLEVLWRLDWLRALISSRPRRLSRSVAHSLQHPVAYSSEKIRQRTGFEFQPIGEVIALCAAHYRGSPNPFQS